MRRRMLLLLACATFGSATVATLAERAAAATFRVTTTKDAVDDNIGDGVCHGINLPAGTCSLRAAVEEANKDPGADTIQLNPGSIVKPAIYTLTGAAGEDAAVSGDLDVTGPLTIVGSSGLKLVIAARPIIDAGGHDRAFEVQNGGSLTLTGVTVRNGSVAPSGNSASSANEGGAIRAVGPLVLTNDVFTGNSAAEGGAIKSRSSLVVKSSTFTGNKATFSRGGAIFGIGSVSLDRVTVNGNSAAGGDPYGGGLVLAEATATVSDSTFDGNTGDGIGVLSGTLNVTSSTVSRNTTPSVGGGFAIYDGTLTITNSTVSGNSALTGGGIYNSGGSTTLVNDTVVGNAATSPGGVGEGNLYAFRTIALENTIVARAALGGNCSGIIQTLGHNLEDTGCGGKASTDLVGVDPMLGPLADNGGPAPTQALLPGSPAIDVADPSACPATDERGVKRPTGSGCDIGAYEFAVTADLAVTLAGAPGGQVKIGEPVTYTATVRNKGPDPATGTTLTDVVPAGAAVQSVKTSAGTCTLGAAIVCSLGGLADEGTATVTIVVVPGTAGTLHDAVSVKALQVDPDASSNSTAVDTIVAAPEVVTPAPAGSGGGPTRKVTARIVAAHGSRVRGHVRVRVVLVLAKPLKTQLAILHSGHVVARTKLKALRKGRRPLVLKARQKTAAGRYVVRVTFTDAGGHRSRLTVKMKLR